MSESENFISWWKIQYEEIDVHNVANAVRQKHISLGPLTAKLEEELADKLSVPYVLATTSGSMAILMSLIALDLKPSDEVIVPNRTWIAVAHAAMMLGLKVVLIDVLENIPIMDVKKIEEKITSKTKAIIPTALNGRGVHFKEIQRIAEKYRLHIIEDAAQAMFSYEEGLYSGTRGDIGCFSLSLAKLVPSGQGGIIATRDEGLYRELRKIRTHGVDDLMDCNFTRFGFNFRYTDLQAAIALSQLKKLPNKIVALKQIYHLYEKGLRELSKVKIIPVSVARGELPLYIEVYSNEREQLMHFLDTCQIQTKAFYPNLNRAKYLNSFEQSFINADKFEEKGLVLPCGPDQSYQDICRVVNMLEVYENTSYSSNQKIGQLT